MFFIFSTFFAFCSGDGEKFFWWFFDCACSIFGRDGRLMHALAEIGLWGLCVRLGRFEVWHCSEVKNPPTYESSVAFCRIQKSSHRAIDIWWWHGWATCRQDIGRFASETRCEMRESSQKADRRFCTNAQKKIRNVDMFRLNSHFTHDSPFQRLVIKFPFRTVWSPIVMTQPSRQNE